LPEPNTDAYSYANGYTYSYANGYTYAYTHTDANSDSAPSDAKAAAHAVPSADSVTGRRIISD
jgi:hypothetical protein